MENKEFLKQIIENNKAHNAIIELYKNHFNEELILELISLGQLGEKGQKKSLSIKMTNTMYDKTISEYLVNRIKEFDILEKFEIYQKEMYDNNFLIILFPQKFSLEFIEKSPKYFEFDYVDFSNKISNPETAGAFYSVQLGILENLFERKKQASILIIRLMKFNEGIGAKKLREIVRKIEEINSFENLEQTSNFIEKNYLKHFKYFKESQILRNLNKKKLNDYF